MGWVKGSDRNFEASQTERQRKTKENVDGRRVEARRSGVRRRGSNTRASGSGPWIALDDDDVYYLTLWELKRKVGFIEKTAIRHRWGG